MTTEPDSITLQQAIDKVSTTGGTICVAAGVHDIGPGVTIDQARSVTIRGQGTATILVAEGTAITVTSSLSIGLERMAIVSGAQQPAAVRIGAVAGMTVEDVVVLSYEGDRAEGAAIELRGAALSVALRRNVLVGETGIDGGDGNQKPGILAAGLRIEDNVVVGRSRGIDLGWTSAYMYDCAVTGNDIVGGRAAAIFATGSVRPGGSLAVRANTIVNDGQGIVVGTDVAVERNVLSSDRPSSNDSIVIEDGAAGAATGHVRVVDNRVHGRRGTAIALRTSVSTFVVTQNVVTDAATGIAVQYRGAAAHVAIERNQLVGLGDEDGGGALPAFGIVVARADSVTVADNTIARFGVDRQVADVHAAIAVLGCTDVRVSGNVVNGVGVVVSEAGMAFGIVVAGPFQNAIVSENSVRAGVDLNRKQWQPLLVMSTVAPATGAAPVPFKLGPNLAIIGNQAGALLLSDEVAAAVALRDDHATIVANVLEGGGLKPTCLVRVRGDIVADANHCTQLAGTSKACVLGGATVTASTNRVRGGGAQLLLEVGAAKFAAVGNITANGTLLVTGSTPAPVSGPWNQLNPIVP